MKQNDDRTFDDMLEEAKAKYKFICDKIETSLDTDYVVHVGMHPVTKDLTVTSPMKPTLLTKEEANQLPSLKNRFGEHSEVVTAKEYYIKLKALWERIWPHLLLTKQK